MPAKKVSNKKRCNTEAEVGRLGAALEMLQREFRDAAEQFSAGTRRMDDLELDVRRLEGAVQGRSKLVHCKCTRKYTGQDAPGRRRCSYCGEVF